MVIFEFEITAVGDGSYFKFKNQWCSRGGTQGTPFPQMMSGQEGPAIQ